MSVEMGDNVGEQVIVLKSKDPKDWAPYQFEASDKAERDQAILDRVKAGDFQKIHAWMPEWKAEKPLTLQQISKISFARQYVNGEENDLFSQGTYLFDLDEITALRGERARLALNENTRVPAPVHRNNNLLSMMDRYETEMWVEAQIKSEQEAVQTAIAEEVGAKELRPAA